MASLSPCDSSRLSRAWGSTPFPPTQAVEVGTHLGISQSHTIKLLHQLSAAGWLTRIKKGLYAINDSVTKLPKAHPFAIGAAIVTPSAVSHWSALQHWGLTEQIPSTVTLSSPVRTFPPTDDADDSGSRPAWTVAGVRYELVTITRPRFFGVKEVWVSERNRVPIFDRERALLHAFHHFHIFGSLSVAVEILEDHLAEIDVDRLVEYAVRLDVAAVVKRLGWALEEFGTPADVLAPLRAYPARGGFPLDLGRRAAATIRSGALSRTCTMAADETPTVRPLRLWMATAHGLSASRSSSSRRTTS